MKNEKDSTSAEEAWEAKRASQTPEPCPHCGAPLYPGESCEHDPATRGPEPFRSRVASSWEVEDIGPRHASYFSGRGVAFSDWDEVHVGRGDTPREALDDALESLAHGWDLVEEPVPEDELGDPDSTEVADSREEAISDCLPAPLFRVRFLPHAGHGPTLDEEHDTAEDARASAAEHVRELRSMGRVTRLRSREDEDEGDLRTFEVETDSNRDGIAVTDWDGFLVVDSNANEILDARERAEEQDEGELGYLVAVYVREGELVRDTPSESELQSVEPLRWTVEKTARESYDRTREILLARRWYLVGSDVRGIGGTHPTGRALGDSVRLAFRAAPAPWGELEREDRARRIAPYLREETRLARAILATEPDPEDALERLAKRWAVEVESIGFDDDPRGTMGSGVYVNAGDTYAATIVYDSSAGAPFVGSWGGWIEGAEETRTEDTGEHRCAYCGEWTELGPDTCHPEAFEGIPAADLEISLRELDELGARLGFEEPRDLAEGAARAAFVSQYADATEEAGDNGPGPGGEWCTYVSDEETPLAFGLWGADIVREWLAAADREDDALRVRLRADRAVSGRLILPDWLAFEEVSSPVAGCSLLGWLLGMAGQGHGVGPADEGLPSPRTGPYSEAPEVELPRRSVRGRFAPGIPEHVLGRAAEVAGLDPFYGDTAGRTWGAGPFDVELREDGTAEVQGPDGPRLDELADVILVERDDAEE